MTQFFRHKYDIYNPSDSAWIIKYPKSWLQLRLKDVIEFDNSFQIPQQLKSTDLVEFVPMSNVDPNLGIITKYDFVPLKNVISGYTKFKNDDVIFAKITPCMENGNCALVSNLVNNVGFGSTEFMVFRSKPKLTSEYLHYFLHNDLFLKNAEPFMKGTAGQKRITSLYMLTHTFALPSKTEQTAIANYLDEKTALIDRKIDLLTQKADRYKELKQSLINETVTRGLDKSVKLKDSGVEWIGEIPEHWGVVKVSHSFSKIGSGTTPKSGLDLYYENGTINWINTGDLNDGILSACKRKVTEKAMTDYSLTIYPKGSIIIAMYGATIGKVSLSLIEGCTNQACCILNQSKTILNKFMFYWFLSKREYIISLSYGGGQPNISQDTIKNLRLGIPSINEQTQITKYLDDKTSQIAKIVESINTQIAKLKELRKTLINDVVTGKIKVVNDEAA